MNPMTRLAARLALVLGPSLLLTGEASAECQCMCLRGKAIPICQPQALVEPICQQICTDKVDQALTGGGLGGVGSPTAGAGMNALGAAGSGNSASTMRSLMGR